MSTLKAKTIQPVSDSDTLVLRTGASDSLTLDTNGNATIRGELTVDGIPIGQGLGNKNTNTRVGIDALNATTSPSTDPYNTALGIRALSTTNTGYYNTGLGGQALQNNTIGIENTAVGLNSGKNNTTGNYNTAIGSQAGPDAGTRTSTTCIGRNAVASADNSVALGYNSSATTANSIYLGNSAVTSLYMGNGSAVAPAYVVRAYGFIPATQSTTYPQSPSTADTKNVSSITTINSQVTTVNFATAMATSKYAVVGMARYKGAVANQPLIFISPAYISSSFDTYANTTSSFSYTTWDNSTDAADYNYRTDVSFAIISI